MPLITQLDFLSRFGAEKPLPNVRSFSSKHSPKSVYSYRVRCDQLCQKLQCLLWLVINRNNRTLPALPQKSWTMSDSALPPDVRRWLCPADSSQIIPGYAPGSG